MARLRDLASQTIRVLLVALLVLGAAKAAQAEAGCAQVLVQQEQVLTSDRGSLASEPTGDEESQSSPCALNCASSHCCSSITFAQSPTAPRSARTNRSGYSPRTPEALATIGKGAPERPPQI
jgi:predicted lipoprotein with Yx(FWY)xxD motif